MGYMSGIPMKKFVELPTEVAVRLTTNSRNNNNSNMTEMSVPR